MTIRVLTDSRLPSGFPRQAGTWVEIGGVRTAFPMPEVISVALGGGTKVIEQDGIVSVGPESVGHRLLQEGLIFGGETLTTTGAQDQRPRLHTIDLLQISWWRTEKQTSGMALG